MEERRKLERFKLRLPTILKVESQNGEPNKNIINLKTDNICSGGAFFNTSSPLPEGTKVKLSINLLKLKTSIEEQPIIKICGKILRTEPAGMAIGFNSQYKIVTLSNK